MRGDWAPPHASLAFFRLARGSAIPTADSTNMVMWMTKPTSRNTSKDALASKSMKAMDKWHTATSVHTTCKTSQPAVAMFGLRRQPKDCVATRMGALATTRRLGACTCLAVDRAIR
eukprot:364569-Chlamydomonas_euryale.AAC.18